MTACLHHSSVLHAPGSAHHANCISISNLTCIHATCAFSHVIHRLAEPTLVTFRMRCIRHLNMDLDHALITNGFIVLARSTM